VDIAEAQAPDAGWTGGEEQAASAITESVIAVMARAVGVSGHTPSLRVSRSLTLASFVPDFG
jgi:hypothetical protein